MTTTTTTQPTARQLADDMATLLEWHDVYAPHIAAELRRTINISIPLANAVFHGWVRQLTMTGRRHLEDGLIELGKAYQVTSQAPDLWDQAPRAEFWNAVHALGTYTEDDVPAMLEGTRQLAAQPAESALQARLGMRMRTR